LVYFWEKVVILLETIKNGFTSIIDLITTIWDFIVNVFTSLGNLLLQLPEIVKTVTAAIGLLPSVLLSAAIFCYTIRIIVITLNKDAGGS
jgi:phage-related protein